METTTATPSGLNLKITKVNQYYKNGNLVYVFGCSGSTEAIAQYEADQASKPKGIQYHEVTKAPLFWSTDLGDNIVRGKDGQWRVNNEVERAVSQKIKSLNRVGNDVLADKLADRLADDMIASIKSAFTKRSAPASTPTPESVPAKEQAEGLDGV
jgi:hypothetical protein